MQGKESPRSSMDSDLEAFSHNPADGSFAALPDQTAANQFDIQIEQAMGDEELIRLGKQWVKGRTWKANASRYSEIYTYLERNDSQS